MKAYGIKDGGKIVVHSVKKPQDSQDAEPHTVPVPGEGEYMLVTRQQPQSTQEKFEEEDVFHWMAKAGSNANWMPKTPKAKKSNDRFANTPLTTGRFFGGTGYPAGYIHNEVAKSSNEVIEDEEDDAD